MMRVCCAVTIVATFALPPAALARQANAGARRPNLHVLQNLPEAQLFPVMNLVADSLGVQCDYCHVQARPDFSKSPSNVGGWVWDSDDKAPKRTAREMMQMVVDLNAARFGGAARVTCYTCHRGSTQPTRTSPQPPPPAGAARTGAPPLLPDADRVWANYLAAIGRIDDARATTIAMSGWDDRSEGRYGKIEIASAADDRYRSTLTTPDGATIQAMDRDAAWVSAGGRVQQLTSADVPRIRRVALRYRAIKADRPAGLRVTGVERLAGGDAFIATAKIDAVTTRTLYFDVVTGLLRRDVTTTETMLLPLIEQVEYDDYRDVNGMQMAFRIRTSDGAPYDTITRTFLKIERGVAVDESWFRAPQR